LIFYGNLVCKSNTTGNYVVEGIYPERYQEIDTESGNKKNMKEIPAEHAGREG